MKVSEEGSNKAREDSPDSLTAVGLIPIDLIQKLAREEQKDPDAHL